MNIFEILGPVMVGPSSSHTAGAVRIGLMTRRLLGQKPVCLLYTSKWMRSGMRIIFMGRVSASLSGQN